MLNSFTIIDTNSVLTNELGKLIGAMGTKYTIVNGDDATIYQCCINNVSTIFVEYEFALVQDFDFVRRIQAKNNGSKVILVSQGGSVSQAAEAMKSGAEEFLMLPMSTFQFRKAIDKLNQPTPKAVATEKPPVQTFELVAKDPRTIQVVEMASRVSRTDTSILVTGESGTGKEVLAKFIHQSSTRSEGPFVAINCAAIPENMLEALLFGYEKGAFTGAHQTHIGKFEQAQGGTLFLDEVGEIELGLQAKLLRVLQEREVERLCGKKSIPLNIRVIAATNKNLREAVAKKKFREDLLYRLSVFPIHIPPLRERRMDIVPVTEVLMRRHPDVSEPKPLSDDAKMKLLQYHWPGNIRELDNVVQRALILSTGKEIQADDLMFGQQFSATPEPEPVASSAADPNQLQDGMRRHEGHLIIETLNSVSGSRKEAAARLGISPRTLRYKLAKLRDAGVEVPGFV